MSKSNQFQNNLSAMSGNLVKKAKQKTSVVADEFNALEKAVPTPPVFTQSVPDIPAKTVDSSMYTGKKIGRPREYNGEQAVITIKTDKRVKDMALVQMHRRGLNMVKYISYLIIKDYEANNPRI